MPAFSSAPVELPGRPRCAAESRDRAALEKLRAWGAGRLLLYCVIVSAVSQGPAPSRDWMIA